MMELIRDAHFWVGVAFIVFLAILVLAGVHKFAWKALGDAGDKVRAQLAEAEGLRSEAQALLDQIKAQKAASDKLAGEMLATPRRRPSGCRPRRRRSSRSRSSAVASWPSAGSPRPRPRPPPR